MTHEIKIVLLIYLFLFIGSLIPINLGSLNLFNKGIKDYEATDIVYSKIKSSSNFDDRIVLVNVGVPNRADIASAFAKLDSLGASVVGVDVIFEENKEQQTDSILAHQIKSKDFLVLADILDLNKSEDLPHACNPNFCDKSNIGFINFVAQQKRAIRYFSKQEIHQGLNVDAFAAAIVKKHDLAAYKNLTNRKQSVEQINYHGNQDSYIQIPIQDLLSSSKYDQLINNKIVLLGYLGTDEWSLSTRDKFYTPMNKDFGQKSLPDMFGVVVHANIISMILNDQFINEVNPWLSRLINFILIFGLAYLMRSIFLKLNPGYFKAVRLIQLGLFFLLFILLITIFYFFRIKLNLTTSLIAIVLSWDTVKFYQNVIVNKQKPFRTKT